MHKRTNRLDKTSIIDYTNYEIKNYMIHLQGQGAIPYRWYSPRATQVAELVKFQYRQYSLDKEDGAFDRIQFCLFALFVT